MFHVFKTGTESRKVGFTNMNAKSSRSHSIFLVTICQKSSKLESIKTGKLYFVDLAGSERLGKTGVEGVGLEEAKNINKSLLALGNCINALTEGKYATYRESKLTRMLQESLGGNSLTTLIITISMSAFNDKESLSTLRFGSRAKTIKNKIKQNTEKSVKELKMIITSLEDKISELNLVISNKGELCSPAPIPHAVEEQQQSVIQSPDKKEKGCLNCGKALLKITNQHIEITSLNEDIENLKLDKEEIESELILRNQEIVDIQERLQVCESQKKYLIEGEIKAMIELENKLRKIRSIKEQNAPAISESKKKLESLKNDIYNTIKSKKAQISNPQPTPQNNPINIKILYKSLSELISCIKSFESQTSVENNLLAEVENLLEKKRCDVEIDENLFKDEFIGSCCYNDEIDDDICQNSSFHNSSFTYPTRNYLSDLGQVTKEKDNSFSNRCSRKCLFKRLDILQSKSGALKSYTKRSEPFSSSIIHDDTFMNQSNYSDYKSNKIVKDADEEACQTKPDMQTMNEDLSRRVNAILYEKQEVESRMIGIIHSLEDKIINLENLLKDKEQELNNYEIKSCQDLQSKDEKMLNLSLKVADLEDENYKLHNLIKDKDKKKYHLVEKQCKDLTSQLQSYIAEKNELANRNKAQEAEVKGLNQKLKELETRIHELNQESIRKYSSTQDQCSIYLNRTPKKSVDNELKESEIQEIVNRKLSKLNNIGNSIYRKSESLHSSSSNIASVSGGSKVESFNYGSRNTSHFNFNNKRPKIKVVGDVKFIRGGAGCQAKANKDCLFYSKMLTTLEEEDPTITKTLSHLHTENHEKYIQFKLDEQIKNLEIDGDEDEAACDISNLRKSLKPINHQPCDLSETADSKPKNEHSMRKSMTINAFTSSTKPKDKNKKTKAGLKLSEGINLEESKEKKGGLWSMLQKIIK